jgi:hypothetical protein
MRARERVKEVEEGSWTCCRTKKRHGELEQLLAARGTCGGCGRRLRDVAGRGKASRGRTAADGRAGGPGGACRAARGSWQPGRSPVKGGRRRSRATERKGREEDDGDLFAIFQKFKGFTIK